jgi:hypothetical protein
MIELLPTAGKAQKKKKRIFRDTIQEFTEVMTEAINHDCLLPNDEFNPVTSRK